MSSHRLFLPALTGLRFVAAALIMAYHAPDFRMLPKNWAGPFLPFQAVGFFFVLSGFILQATYRAKVAGLGWIRFMGMRAGRI